jgi:Kef-type K+ transport system membrane component KefB
MIDNILLVLFVLIFCAKIVGSLFEKIGLDSSLGELLVGILFGVSFLNLVKVESVEPFAILGSVLILFIAGMKEENIEEVLSDKAARSIGLSLLFITTAIMSLFFFFVPRLFGLSFSILQSVVFGIAFAIVDIGVPAKVLISKGLINLPVGRITIRSAVINLVIGLLLFTFASLLVNFNTMEIMKKLLNIGLFVAIIVLLMFFLSKISKFVMKLHIEEAEFSMAILLVLFLAYFTDFIGFSSVLGAFIAGQLIMRTPFAETKSFTDKIKSLSFGLFVPLFFVWFGLGININEIIQNLGLSMLIFFLYVAIRFAVTYFMMKRYKMDMSALVSSSMLSVDVESLIVLIIATRIGIFSNNLPLILFAPSVFFSTLLIVILVAAFSKKKASGAVGKINA